MYLSIGMRRYKFLMLAHIYFVPLVEMVLLITMLAAVVLTVVVLTIPGQSIPPPTHTHRVNCVKIDPSV